MKNIIKFINKMHEHIGDDDGSIGTWREGIGHWALVASALVALVALVLLDVSALLASPM